MWWAQTEREHQQIDTHTQGNTMGHYMISLTMVPGQVLVTRNQVDL